MKKINFFLISFFLISFSFGNEVTFSDFEKNFLSIFKKKIEEVIYNPSFRHSRTLYTHTYSLSKIGTANFNTAYSLEMLLNNYFKISPNLSVNPDLYDIITLVVEGERRKEVVPPLDFKVNRRDKKDFKTFIRIAKKKSLYRL